MKRDILTSVIAVVQPVQNKLIRVIASFGEKRDPDFPDVPTMIELGYKDVHFVTRQGVTGPPGMNKEIVDIVASAVAKAVRNPKFKEISARQGFTIDPLPASEFHKWGEDMYAQAKKFLTQAGEVKQ